MTSPQSENPIEPPAGGLRGPGQPESASGRRASIEDSAMDRGWVKLWRKSTNSGLMQNHRLWTFWTWCLLKASYRRHKQMVGMQIVELEPGQFIFGRKAAAAELKMSERNIRTCVSFLTKSQNLTIRTTNKYSIVTINNWPTYQADTPANDQQLDQQVTSKRPASDQQVTTNKKVKKVKKGKKEPNRSPNGDMSGKPDGSQGEEEKKRKAKELRETCKRVIDYLNATGGKRYRHGEANIAPIRARLKEGFTEADCRKVIEKKWADPDFPEKYFCPETLFRPSKFEKYLQQGEGRLKLSDDDERRREEESIERQRRLAESLARQRERRG